MHADSSVFDVRSGAPVDISPDVIGHFHAMIDNQRSKARHDSRLNVLDPWTQAVAARIDAAIAMLSPGDSRRDAFTPQAGLYMARDLEYTYDEVLREPFPEPNALRLFTTDGSVPVGAESHRVRRLYQEGEVGWYKDGSAVPRVDIAQREMTFPVKYAVTSFGYSIFQRMNAEFARSQGNISFDMHGEKMRAARQMMAEFNNRALWFGAPQVGLFGVINYPWLPKKAIATAFNGDSDPRDILAELNRLANYPHEMSNSVFQPDRMAMSPALRNYLFETPWSPLDSTGKTIGKYFLENHPRISTIDEAWELAGVGPNNEDGILVWKGDRLGITIVTPGGPFNALPPQEVKFDLEINCWSASGGVIMRDAGANVLGFVTPPVT